MSKKEYVIIAPYKAFNWLLNGIMDDIRGTYNVAFIILIPEGLTVPEIIKGKITDDDIILPTPDISTFFNNLTLKVPPSIFWSYI